MPKWSTPERQAKLIELFQRSGGFCVFGERPCSSPYYHHYENFIRDLIKDWVADDREARSYEYKIAKANLHRIPEVGRLKGRFNFVSREVFYDAQPTYYIEQIGIDGLTLKPFAKVRLASGYTRLHVELGDTLPMSKHQRRKVRRYGKLPYGSLPDMKQIEERCNLAINRFLSR